jgi:hypothetical protein
MKRWLRSGRALEEAERTSPRYAMGNEVRRRGYARYRFLKVKGLPL